MRSRLISISKIVHHVNLCVIVPCNGLSIYSFSNYFILHRFTLNVPYLRCKVETQFIPGQFSVPYLPTGMFLGDERNPDNLKDYMQD